VVPADEVVEAVVNGVQLVAAAAVDEVRIAAAAMVGVAELAAAGADALVFFGGVSGSHGILEPRARNRGIGRGLRRIPGMDFSRESAEQRAQRAGNHGGQGGPAAERPAS
jgi:ornithine cyclodeaminase/alanine dehydrogenase-like protein (mu-crystallin family)